MTETPTDSETDRQRQRGMERKRNRETERERARERGKRVSLNTEWCLLLTIFFSSLFQKFGAILGP